MCTADQANREDVARTPATSRTTRQVLSAVLEIKRAENDRRDASERRRTALDRLGEMGLEQLRRFVVEQQPFQEQGQVRTRTRDSPGVAVFHGADSCSRLIPKDTSMHPGLC